jgi:hypothetical protein
VCDTYLRRFSMNDWAWDILGIKMINLMDSKWNLFVEIKINNNHFNERIFLSGALILIEMKANVGVTFMFKFQPTIYLFRVKLASPQKVYSNYENYHTHFISIRTHVQHERCEMWDRDKVKCEHQHSNAISFVDIFGR